jgi:hypothetical protein
MLFVARLMMIMMIMMSSSRGLTVRHASLCLVKQVHVQTVPSSKILGFELNKHCKFKAVNFKAAIKTVTFATLAAFLPNAVFKYLFVSLSLKEAFTSSSSSFCHHLSLLSCPCEACCCPAAR